MRWLCMSSLLEVNSDVAFLLWMERACHQTNPGQTWVWRISHRSHKTLEHLGLLWVCSFLVGYSRTWGNDLGSNKYPANCLVEFFLSVARYFLSVTMIFLTPVKPSLLTGKKKVKFYIGSGCVQKCHEYPNAPWVLLITSFGSERWFKFSIHHHPKSFPHLQSVHAENYVDDHKSCIKFSPDCSVHWSNTVGRQWG